MEKIWKINEKPPKEFLEQFPEYSKLTLQLLWDRGLKTQKEIDEFFSPDYDQDLHDPFLMKGMKESIERIKKALANKEKITIFGDYDADGVCGTAILNDVLNILGAEPKIYIPDRNKEGYGLNLKAIEEAASQKTNLIITIDCGITDFDEIELANKLGMDAIIVDHHEVPAKLPRAFSIIDPRQKDEKYPFKKLAASGVAFKVAQALLKSKVKSQKLKIAETWEKWLLDLTAIATVTDRMPLIGENRTLVKYGLVVLAQTKRPGLQELMRIAKITPVLNQKLLITNLDVYTLGFILGPRLNAAGRMDHANTAYELLVTKSRERAEELAVQLNNKNQERQKLTDKIVKEIEGRIDVDKEKIIFEGDESWPIGIVGLIAGKLCDKYSRPALIYQKMENISKGSARSIDAFNIVETLSECGKLLEEFGGHPGAAGFAISNENLEKFKEKIMKIANQRINQKDIIPIVDIDLEVEPTDLSFEAYDELQKFAPFGDGNIRPLFVMRNLQLLDSKMVGNNGNHLKCRLSQDSKDFSAIGFGLSDFYDKIKQGDKVDVVFELIANEWNGTKELQLKIVDIKKL